MADTNDDKKKKKLYVDPDICAGCQACLAAPNADKFLKFDDSKMIMVATDEEGNEEDLQKIVDACPMGAIKIVE